MLISSRWMVDLIYKSDPNDDDPDFPIPAEQFHRLTDLTLQTAEGAIPIYLVNANPNAQNTDTCPVCTGTVKKCKADRAYLDCMHWFHFYCIKGWLATQAKCPICITKQPTHIYRTKY